MAFATLHKMYYEGSEKKIELISTGAAFRRRPLSFFNHLVELAGAKILSKVSSELCDAYLLSESSLFVWDDRITMLTCGRTTLVRAALFLVDELSPDKVDFLTYERKNEFFPHQQETDFYKDVQLLQARIPGKAFRFGYPDEHHLLIFHIDKPYRPPGADSTLEILMYNLKGAAREIFDSGQTIERIRSLSQLDEILPGFRIDDHLFSPCGYSLNAVRGAEYYTLHVTPEDTGSYVSFETNIRLGDRIASTMRSVIDVFQPRSFDVIYFHPDHELKAFAVASYGQREYVRQTLSCGYEVGYTSYYMGSSDPSAAVQLGP